MSDDPFYLKQIEVGSMGNFLYLVGDKKSGQCLVVDPAWEVPKALRMAGQDGMKVIGGLLTHTHYDHMNGVGELIEATGGKIYVHKNEAGFLKGLKDNVTEVDSECRLSIGEFEVVFIHTPGHTPGSQCFLIQHHLFSGDTLFVGACGRCDLPGGDPRKMYESLQVLAKLPEDVILLPGHDYGETPTSTIGHQLRTNPYYQCHHLSDFLGLRMED
ncbi:MAG: MBL fold metallo-hydrolase [Candidatus Omnitrophica bacterium]|nr:MBL fold metallo-hydrolase [Candidatus Omnitrophota bacterium]